MSKRERSKREMSKRVFMSLAAAAAIASAAPVAKAETSLRLLSSWPLTIEALAQTENAFIKSISDNSKGEIKVQRSGPEVVPTFDQLQPVSSGVFDLLFTHPSYHQSATGVGTLIEAMKRDARQSGEGLAWVTDYYQRRFGMRIIAVVNNPGYQLLLKEPMLPDGTIKGRKIRSNASFDGMVRALGANPVSLPLTEMYPAIQKGVVDGAITAVASTSPMKLQEVVKYVVRPSFGSGVIVIFANAKKFDALSPDLQKAILDAGRGVADFGLKLATDIAERDTETILKAGVQVDKANPAMAAKFEQLYAEGLYDTAQKSAPADVKTFWELIKSKNLMSM